jgi:NAD(P)-dependent dehydrogenase (short-subunit alcohol dehydrogenase family)
VDDSGKRNLLDITGRVSIITGGGTGIGAATARLFAEHGAPLVLAGRTLELLEEVRDEVSKEHGVECIAVRADMKKEDDVLALVAASIEHFGRIDIVINNAGGTRMMPLKSTPTRVWDSNFELNIRGPFLLSREAANHMIAQGSGGSIVSISSAAGVRGVLGGGAYGSAKAALQHFTVIAAGEWGRYRIRVNCLAVGMIASERAVAAWDAQDIQPDRQMQNSPLRRVGQPAEIASTVLFLASDASSYVTGQTLSADGGPALDGIPLED